MPSEPPPPQEQVIEQRLIDCGLTSGRFTVKYEDYLQSIEIVVSADAGATEDTFDCIREAVDHEIVTFEDGEMQMAYLERSAELARPRLLAEARKGLEKRGLLEGFPERTNFASDKLFAEALERHCSVEPGSYFVESEWGLTLQPRTTTGPLGGDEFDRLACLMNAMMYVSAKGEDFKIGIIGNEKFRETEPR